MSKLDEMLEKISRAAGTGQLRVEKIVGCGDMDDLMVALGGQENERHKYNEITPETLSDLKALGQKYVDSLSKLPFALGDLVTSRKSGSDKFHGQPMVVIDTNPVTAPIFEGDCGSTYFGRHPQIRVLVAVDDRFIPFWGEASDYVPYVGPVNNTEINDDDGVF